MIIEFKPEEIIFVSESAEEWIKLLKAREKLMGRSSGLGENVGRIELNQRQRYLAVSLSNGQSDFSIDEDKVEDMRGLKENTFEVEIRT